MNTEELKQAIKNYIIQEFLPGENPDNVTDDLPLISSGILDSIATLKLVLFIEERFGITLEAHETERQWQRIADLTHLVNEGREVDAHRDIPVPENPGPRFGIGLHWCEHGLAATFPAAFVARFAA